VVPFLLVYPAPGTTNFDKCDISDPQEIQRYDLNRSWDDSSVQKKVEIIISPRTCQKKWVLQWLENGART
jgi:hypothetical protein